MKTKKSKVLLTLGSLALASLVFLPAVDAAGAKAATASTKAESKSEAPAAAPDAAKPESPAAPDAAKPADPAKGGDTKSGDKSAAKPGDKSAAKPGGALPKTSSNESTYALLGAVGAALGLGYVAINRKRRAV